MSNYCLYQVCFFGVLLIALSFLCKFSYGSKRIGVVKTGTTVGPNFHRISGTYSTKCPASHPNVLEKGHYCCADNREVESLPTCDSSKLLGPASKKECCSNLIKCPYQLCRGIDGVWSTWSPWSGVSTYCVPEDAYFDDRKKRIRECLSDQYGVQICRPVGDVQEEMGYIENPTCPPVDGEWSTWGPWTVFSAYCASADAYYDDKKKRSRECLSEQRGNQICSPVGSTEEEIVPNENANPACPIIDGEWSTWGPWSEVSTFCAAANAYFDDRKLRNRECQSEENGEQICQPVGGTEEQVLPNENASPSCREYSEVVVCGGYTDKIHWKCRLNRLDQLGSTCVFPALPEVRSNGAFGRISSGNLWYCGGRIETTVPKTGCIEYRKSTHNWRKLTSAEAGVAYSHNSHGVQVNTNNFLIIGGSEKVGTDKNAAMLKTYYFESSSGKLARGPNLPSARMFTCSALFNESHVIVIGGLGSSGNVITEVLINGADFSTAGGWTKITDMPTARQECACGVARPGYYVEDSPELIVVAAGKVGGTKVKTVDIYDTGTGEWRTGPQLPYTLSPTSSVPYLGSFVILHKKHYLYLDFDTTTKDWLWKELTNANNLSSQLIRGVTTKKGAFTC